METSGYYRDKECTLADFSEDGSVLAVVFENTLTFWDPIENQLCTSIDQGAKITALQFCHGAQANCVVVATEANKSSGTYSTILVGQIFILAELGCLLQ